MTPRRTRERAGRPGVASLTTLTVRGFAWSFTGSVGKALLQIVSMVVLARLLTPAEFGAAAAAALVVGLAQVVSQLGVGAALVHRRSLTDTEVAAAFYFSLLLAIALAAVLFVLAPIINGLVGLPSDSHLLRLASVALILAGVAAVPTGLMQRQMRFRSMAAVEVLAFGPAAIGVSVLLAVQGMGAVSLVWGQIAAALFTAAGYLALTRPSVRPASPTAAWRSIRPLLGYGSGYSLSQLGNWFALNGDSFVVASVLGPAPLGIYTRAYNLLAQPANVIGAAVDKALFPAMAKVRDDAERLLNAYLRAASLVAFMTVPSSVLLFVLAPELVRILLGSGWSAVVVPLQVFAVVLLPRASYKISGSLTRAIGAVYRGAWRQWLYAVEVVVACSIGAQWGVNGVAIGASIAITLHFLVMLHLSTRVVDGLSAAVLRLYLKYLPVAGVALGASVTAAALVRPLGSELLTVLLTSVAGGLATLLVLLGLRRFFRDEIGIVRRLVTSRGSPSVVDATEYQPGPPAGPETEGDGVSGPAR